jgi:hypothetical protein
MAFSGLGSGTEADPYQITTVAQLQEMKDYLTSSFILMNDIDASSTETLNADGDIYNGFQPIGDSTDPFTGTFDGDDYTISDLYINRDDTNEHAALFGCIRKNISYTKVTNGTFTSNANGWTLGSGWSYNSNNVKITPGAGLGTMTQDCSVVAGETYILSYAIGSYAAGSVTASCGGVTLSTYSSTGTKTQTFTATSSGILTFTPTDTANMTVDTVVLTRVLTFKDVKLKNCDITGYYAAGFASMIYGTVSASHTLFNNIEVQGRIEGKNDTGGFCQHIYSDCDFTDCSVNAALYHTVSGDGNDFGGFVANLSGGTFTDCTTDGVMSASGDFSGSATVSKSVGGFVAIAEESTTDVFSGCRSGMNMLVTTQTTSTKIWTGIGGFIGYDAAGITCTLCGSTGSITYTGNRGTSIGGFGAIVSNGAISKCYAKGNIYASSVTEGTLYCGGFSGSAGTASDCYAWGDVCSTGVSGGATSACGGFAGYSAAALTDCYSTGYVTSESTYHGGFIGNKASGTTTTCYWDTESSGQSSGKMGAGSASGITGLSTSQAILTSSYTGFDFTSTWEEGTATAYEQQGSNITLWTSVTGDYNNFDAGDGDKDTDAILYDIPTQNEIRWLSALESLLVGTDGDEWKVGSNKLDTPLTPTNLTIKQQSEYGSNQVQPVKINSSILFIDYVSRKLREMTYIDPKYESPDLTALAEHITKSGITSIARQKNPDSILWFTLGDGSLISMTYEREQNVLAWSKHPLARNGLAQSVCVLPGATEDVVYIAVSRTFAGESLLYGGEQVLYGGEEVVYGEITVTCIEKMMPRVFDSIEDCFFVDCGITIENSPASATLTGLDHFRGETIKILGDGVVLDDITVSEGTGTAQTAGVDVEVSKAQVGLAFTSKLQPMRIVLGDSMGSITRVNEIVLSVMDTGAVQYGPNADDLKDVDLSKVGLTNLSEIDGLFTGETVVNQSAGFDVLNPIVLATDEPLPCTVRALVPRIDRTGR